MRTFTRASLLAPILLVAIAGCGSEERTYTSAESQAIEDAFFGTSPTSPDTTESDAGGSKLNDVAIDSCGTDELGWTKATLRVTNNSSKRSDYVIEVVFESADGSLQFGTGVLAVDGLEPGQTKVDTASSYEEPTGSLMRCTIRDVSRWASL